MNQLIISNLWPSRIEANVSDTLSLITSVLAGYGVDKAYGVGLFGVLSCHGGHFEGFGGFAVLSGLFVFFRSLLPVAGGVH